MHVDEVLLERHAHPGHLLGGLEHAEHLGIEVGVLPQGAPLLDHDAGELLSPAGLLHHRGHVGDLLEIIGLVERDVVGGGEGVLGEQLVVLVVGVDRGPVPRLLARLEHDLVLAKAELHHVPDLFVHPQKGLAEAPEVEALHRCVDLRPPHGRGLHH